MQSKVLVWYKKIHERGLRCLRVYIDCGRSKPLPLPLPLPLPALVAVTVLPRPPTHRGYLLVHRLQPLEPLFGERAVVRGRAGGGAAGGGSSQPGPCPRRLGNNAFIDTSVQNTATAVAVVVVVVGTATATFAGHKIVAPSCRDHSIINTTPLTYILFVNTHVSPPTAATPYFPSANTPAAPQCFILLVYHLLCPQQQTVAATPHVVPTSITVTAPHATLTLTTPPPVSITATTATPHATSTLPPITHSYVIIHTTISQRAWRQGIHVGWGRGRGRGGVVLA